MHHLMYDNTALDRAVANKIYQSDVSVCDCFFTPDIRTI